MRQTSLSYHPLFVTQELWFYLTEGFFDCINDFGEGFSRLMRRFSMALVRFKGTSIQLTGDLMEMGNVTKELCPINSQKKSRKLSISERHKCHSSTLEILHFTPRKWARFRRIARPNFAAESIMTLLKSVHLTSFYKPLPLKCAVFGKFSLPPF